MWPLDTLYSWLVPDKTEESYRIFIHLVKKALENLNLSIDVKSVIMDFEIAMVKAVDSMVKAEIDGCFFSFLQSTD